MKSYICDETCVIPVLFVTVNDIFLFAQFHESLFHFVYLNVMNLSNNS